jgi:hypothetical protein
MNRLDRHQQAIELAKTPVPYSHSIVNRWSRLRGKTRRLPADNGADTDRSTVTFESTPGALYSRSHTSLVHESDWNPKVTCFATQ